MAFKFFWMKLKVINSFRWWPHHDSFILFIVDATQTLPFTMNLFKSVRKFYETMGIYPPLSNQNCSLNSRNLFFLIPTIAPFVSSFCYLISKPTSVLERTESIYIILTHLACTSIFVVSYRKIGTISLLIGKLNELIDVKSKL